MKVIGLPHSCINKWKEKIKRLSYFKCSIKLHDMNIIDDNRKRKVSKPVVSILVCIRMRIMYLIHVYRAITM